jgi:putative inorganic carbon (hco3(-)) transporter
MITVYAFTVVILSIWLIKCIVEKRINFKRSLLDIPLIIFIASQLLSTLVSLDQRTSFLGYYSRFNGGFFSVVAYSILYWAYVSNMNSLRTINTLKVTFISAIIVAIWGIFEHFGRSFSCLLVPPAHSFDVSCWVQDVQNRVFATLGQPNWMAAWIVALIPLSWAFALTKYKNKINSFKGFFNNQYYWIAVSALLFNALIFTKSRSGYLGFFSSLLVFFLLLSIKVTASKELIVRRYLAKRSLTIVSLIILLIIAFGTPWTPSANTLLYESEKPKVEETKHSGTVLEVGGTESGEIRKIVWKGAIDVWKAYPVLGSGVETFAYSYYKYRPLEHNLVSEWDFLYNKAHNEYLNYAATTGTFGLISYLILISFSILAFLKTITIKYDKKNIKQSQNNDLIKSNNSGVSNPDGGNLSGDQDFSITVFGIALLSGYISILVTNFFGFSVVPVALSFFLFPAFAYTLNLSEEQTKPKPNTLSIWQITMIVFVLTTAFYVLLSIFRYWQADYYYSLGRLHNQAGSYPGAREYLQKALDRSPNEAIYWDEYAKNEGYIALLFHEQAETELSYDFAQSADNASLKALHLSPANINLKRNRANIMARLSAIDPDYLISALQTLESAVSSAPTEAKLIYNLGLMHLRTGNVEKGANLVKQAVDMKPNYRDARYALALVLIEAEEYEAARVQLEYIVNYINPGDKAVIEELESLK